MDVVRKTQGGRALTVSRVRSSIFIDSAMDDPFERLIKLTQRVSLIIELTGSDASHARMKAYIRQNLLDCGIEPSLPRGNPMSYESRTLLKFDDDRLDASYLMALHYGPRGPGEFSEVETDLVQALVKRLEVYGRYCSDLYPAKSGKSTPRLSFEEYIVIERAVQNKVVLMQACPECKGNHVYNARQTILPTCPYCNRMKLEMNRARAELGQRIHERRAAAQRSEAGQRRVVGAISHRLDGMDRPFSDRKAFSPYG